ncbi:MAG: type II toxin-antitoxin system RelE/ParE family toxin [Gammaproteobacteria bacterium]|nr:MAG: type II toxin-antitoxin system RelE/ParE family toxin [Gammaproteobacteria bacterium]
MQLKWTEPASQDLDKIEEYISRDNSPAVAIDIVLEVIETVEMVLPAHPRAGRMGRVTGTRELIVEGVPFIVIYRQIGSDQLQIIRVLHDAQQWPPGN